MILIVRQVEAEGTEQQGLMELVMEMVSVVQADLYLAMQTYLL